MVVAVLLLAVHPTPRNAQRGVLWQRLKQRAYLPFDVAARLLVLFVFEHNRATTEHNRGRLSISNPH